MSCHETIFNSCGVWQHAFFHLSLMMVQFRTNASVNWFFIFTFWNVLQHYLVIHNLWDLCSIKSSFFVQEIAYIPKKR